MDRSAEDHALLALARAVVGVSTRAADRLGEVTVVQLRALTVLRRLGTTNLRELAEGMAVTVSTTSRLVDRLASAGLVERQPSPRTGREIEVRMTAAGRELLDRYDDLRLVDLRAGLAGLPGGQRPGLVAALLEFAAATDAGGEAATPATAAG